MKRDKLDPWKPPKLLLISILAVFLLTFGVRSLEMDSSFCRCETSSHFGKPFVVLWNSPTEGCHVNFSVNIELEKFGILTNTNQTWDGEVVTVFYNAQLGLYPSIDENDSNVSYNGGLPQLVNITNHLSRASQDIAVKIPDPDYNGVAVIDWERWRPLWETNFGKKRIYQRKSVELVKKENILKKKEKIVKEAKTRFDLAARRLMEETVKLARKLRPKALWGFYGFPQCHGNITTGYTCRRENKKWNDAIDWLYRSSTALFPSIYLMEEHKENHKFVTERLTEAFRIAQRTAQKTKHMLPVFPYLRPLYLTTSHQFKLLNEDDLENAVGQAADLGSAGLILWGNHYDERTSKAVCRHYNNYVNKKLGPYVTLLTEELETCSKDKCSSNGRCIERSLLPTELFYYEININKSSACDVPKMKHAAFNMISHNNSMERLNTSLTHLMEDLEQPKGRTTGTKIKNITLLSKGSLVKLKKPNHDGNTTETVSNIKEDIKDIKNLVNSSIKSLLKKQLLGQHRTMALDESANNTHQKKKPGFDPNWNKNGILGLLQDDHLSTRSRIDPELAKRNSTSEESKNSKTHTSNSETEENDTKTKRLHETAKNPSSDKQSNNDQQANNHSRKRGYSATVTEDTAVHIPSVYIILITVTLGGALLMTIIYVAIYYAVNVRGRSHDHSYDYNYGCETDDENPFSIDTGPWWNENIEEEKLLKSTDEKR